MDQNSFWKMKGSAIQVLALSGAAFFCGSGLSRGASSPEIGTARSLGMGQAFSAAGNDAGSVFFNPAGLAALRQMEALAGGGRDFQENVPPRSGFFAVGASPMKMFSGGIGNGAVSVSRTGGAQTNDFTDLGFSWAADVGEWWPPRFGPSNFPQIGMGATLRVRQVQRAGTGLQDRGAGVDWGFLYRFAEKTGFLKGQGFVSAVVQELNMGAISAPTRFRLGFCWRQDPGAFAVDLVSQGGETRILPGVEYAFFKKLLLARAGLQDLPGRSRRLTLGMGLILPPFQFDFAYGAPTGDLGRPNDEFLATLTYRFGAPLLSQYIGEEGRQSEQIESRFVDLEFKKKSLESGIRENERLYEKMDKDIKKARERLDGLNAEIRQKERRAQEEEKRVGDLEKEIRRREGKSGPPAAPERSGPRLHKVIQGDTLRGLALKYYGDAERWEEIYRANPGKVRRGAPKVGAELVIP